MLDLVKPEEENKIRLKDLKRCKLTNVFFDTFFNLEKYLENEQKDPFSNLKVRFTFNIEQQNDRFFSSCSGSRFTGSIRLDKICGK